jgi:hypothetical protein
LKETASAELVASVLYDTELDMHAATGAVRALARHADAAEGVDAVRHVLQRKDISFALKLPRGAKPSDRRFELDLAAAEAFSKWGAHTEALQLIAPYIKDTRALVRAYALRLKDSIPVAPASKERRAAMA